MVTPMERASQQLATAQTELKYIRSLIKKEKFAGVAETIEAWREMVKISGGRGASKTTLTNLQALGIIDNLYDGPIDLDACKILLQKP